MQIIILLSLLFLVLVGTVYFFLTLFFSVAYLPSNKLFINGCLEILKKEKIKSVAELGAGDGRLALAIAKTGIQVDAFEINPLFSLLIRLEKIFFAPKTLNVYNKNFYNADFHKYQAVTMYLMTEVLANIEDKLFSQMPKNAIIISNTFQFKKHKPEKVIGKLYLYRVP
jgi:16S rRNA A1518/A1519 N6-dimethyltransferase RsmA/KsgA/DIM1 with predicted DNA glycosylase/AP lyase activity